MKYLQAEIKDASSSGLGGFVARASTPKVDRDGEVLKARCFDPLPASIPILAFHQMTDPIGRGVPHYRGDDLWVEASFGSTVRAQELRQLVLDGVVRHVSVGFMAATRKAIDGVPTVTSGELLECSLVSVPSLREADVVTVRSAGHRVMTPADARRFVSRQLVDLAVADVEEANRVHVRDALNAADRLLRGNA